jgi:low temperature requirement protein LtrA
MSGEGHAHDHEEKRVTWGELFFDLVFVFAVTQVSALLRHDHSWAGVGRALVVFIPIWWGWVGTSIHSNTHDVDSAHDRLGIFAVGLGSLVMALAVPGAYGTTGLMFGAAYLGLRIVLGVLVHGGSSKLTATPFTVGIAVTGPLLLLGGLAHGGLRTGLWVVAAAVDLITPRVLRSRLARLRFDPAHLPERFGLFLIIALGESVVAIGVAASSSGQVLTANRLLAVAAAYALACSLWWVYFQFAASAVHHAVATAEVQTDLVRTVLAYGHLVFISAIIAVAVGLGETVAHPVTPLAPGMAGLLVLGVTLYLATFGYTRWRMFHLVSWTRLGAAVACLPVLPLATAMPALATVLALVGVTVALNVLEARLVRQGQRAASARIEDLSAGLAVETD